MSISQFVRQIRVSPSTETVANPYNCHVQGVDIGPDASRKRQLQLLVYLKHRQRTARFILIAEAPGYQGARFSGLAMTSERLLSGATSFVSEHDILGREGIFTRTSHINACRYDAQRRAGFAEPTATTVWRAVMKAGRSRDVVLWNTFPFHPHPAGQLLNNRTPSAEEIRAQAATLRALRDLFDENCQIIAIGNVARNHLQDLGVEAEHVRHPANGGTNDFTGGLRNFLAPA